MIISPSYQKMNRLGLALFIFCLSSVVFPACTYRFTNLYLRPPLGLRTLAIESVYDTTRAVVPHEKLWESLQHEFAIDGHLLLTPSEQADVYLRAHLTEATITPTGVEGEKRKDITLPQRDKDGNFNPPSAFLGLRKADRYATSEVLSITVNVEVWHLAKKKLLMQRSYTVAGSHKIYNAKIPIESHYLTAGEGFEELFADLSETVAKKVVRDFLSLTEPVY